MKFLKKMPQNFGFPKIMATFVIQNGAMAERLGIGLQNQVQQFDSAWHLKKRL